jgi:hypothetical protein
MNETRRDFMKLVGGVLATAGVLMAGTRSAHADLKPRTGNESREFKAGEKIPASGVYDVVHDRIDGQYHTADHQLTLIAGARFPNCKACQGWVKFRLHQAAGHIGAHPDFA